MTRPVLQLVLLALLVLPFTVHADPGSILIESVEKNGFFPGGLDEWTLDTNVRSGGSTQLEWANKSGHRIALRFREASPAEIENVYGFMGQQLTERLGEVGGEIVTVAEYFALVHLNDHPAGHSVDLLYGTPDGVYWWAYRGMDVATFDDERLIDSVVLLARKHQYESAVRRGNVVAGRWGGAIHAYARLLVGQQDAAAEGIYRELLQVQPANYQAHIDHIAITDDRNAALFSAELTARDAEDVDLLEAAASVLDSGRPPLSSHPALSVEDAGLQVVLIPLDSYNPWLLEEVALLFEEMTTIPVVIRRMPIDWSEPEPTRSAYRPQLEQIASSVFPEQSGFTDWSLVTLKSEIMKKAEAEGPQSVAFIRHFFNQMDEAGYQWDAIPMLQLLALEIEPYYSGDPDTLLVFITGKDVYLRDSNYVFSLFISGQQTPLSLLSYARMRAAMTGENQSRKRLVERVAKELVSASLKIREIPRSIDPACPYSYSDGLQRLDEKTLNLSAPVRLAIETMKDAREKPANPR